MVFTSADGWVNPRRHRNPNFLEIGGGVGDVGNKSTTPSLSKPLLHRNPPISTKRRRRHYYFADESSDSEDEAWPLKPVFDISRLGNLRPPHGVASIPNPTLICSPEKDYSDPSRWRTPRSPATAMKSLSGGLAGYVGDGEAGRVEEMGQPTEIEVELRSEEESLSEISPVASLIISTADQEAWGKAVAYADRWVDERFPCSDR